MKDTHNDLWTTMLTQGGRGLVHRGAATGAGVDEVNSHIGHLEVEI